ncbi:flagellar basal body rod modification protein FlgD [Aureimonas endophytica]|uniref:Basal-body rod modification protein FlgD n=1 Tax=Aureimonas endophytica TaxID=2027858 RepID=A0A917A151_9HYPH|nr:flagellar hook assembly protein FlgD [Aureimonas endophytica]GGE19780.1 flagellar basal body rod modification protein FlgD [Aureimonas endophytica]
MTTVTSASSATASTTTTTSTTKTDKEKAALDYNAFLQLLVAQMKNQDPLNPSDPTQQLSQLASFSNVEQSIKLNDKLTTLITTSSLSQADGMIGRTVTSSDGQTTGVVKSVSLKDGAMTAVLTSGKTVALGTGITVE